MKLPQHAGTREIKLGPGAMIQNIKCYENLVGIIYDAALNENAWSTVLKGITQAVYCDNVDFALYDRTRDRQIPNDSSVILTHANVQQIQKYFYGDKAAPTLRLLDGQDLLSLRKMGKSASLTALIVCDTWFAVIVARNSPCQGNFSAAQKIGLERILPHLQRALQLNVKDYELKYQLRVARKVTDKIAVAVLVLANDWTVFELNASGRAILREADGLRLQHNHLGIEGEIACRLFRSFTAINGRRNSSTRFGSEQCLVHRPSGRSPYYVCLCRLQAQRTVCSATQRAELLLLIADPDKTHWKLGSALMHTYGLTGAEARLAAAVANGKTLFQYAEEKSVSIQTVRFQIKQVLQKTDVKRQGDLIRPITKTLVQIEPD